MNAPIRHRELLGGSSKTGLPALRKSRSAKPKRQKSRVFGRGTKRGPGASERGTDRDVDRSCGLHIGGIPDDVGEAVRAGGEACVGHILKRSIGALRHLAIGALREGDDIERVTIRIAVVGLRPEIQQRFAGAQRDGVGNSDRRIVHRGDVDGHSGSRRGGDTVMRGEGEGANPVAKGVKRGLIDDPAVGVEHLRGNERDGSAFGAAIGRLIKRALGGEAADGVAERFAISIRALKRQGHFGFLWNAYLGCLGHRNLIGGHRAAKNTHLVVRAGEVEEIVRNGDLAAEVQGLQNGPCSEVEDVGLGGRADEEQVAADDRCPIEAAFACGGEIGDPGASGAIVGFHETTTARIDDAVGDGRRAAETATDSPGDGLALEINADQFGTSGRIIGHKSFSRITADGAVDARVIPCQVQSPLHHAGFRMVIAEHAVHKGINLAIMNGRIPLILLFQAEEEFLSACEMVEAVNTAIGAAVHIDAKIRNRRGEISLPLCSMGCAPLHTSIAGIERPELGV